MARFVFSLAAAALIVVSGYAALGVAANTASPPELKTIAVVVAHRGHHAAVSRFPLPSTPAVVQ